MLIDRNICVRCQQCVPFCPVGAIRKTEEGMEIDQDTCVECGVCKRSNICPTGALFQPKLEWPRLIRALFSDPITVHPGTGVAGRGTDELKTNDVTDRFIEGKVGFGIEMGRPNTGTDFLEVEKVLRKLVPLGVYFEPANPVTELIKNASTGEIIDEVKTERVLTAIIEFTVDEAKVPDVLEVIKEAAEEIDTVFSLEVINRVPQNGVPSSLDMIKKKGFSLSLNGKVCLGLGRKSKITNK